MEGTVRTMSPKLAEELASKGTPFLTDHYPVSDNTGKSKEWVEVYQLGWDALGAHLMSRLDVFYGEDRKVYWSMRASPSPKDHLAGMKRGDREKIEALTQIVKTMSNLVELDKDLVFGCYQLVNDQTKKERVSIDTLRSKT